ncbi:MAG: c-type cytochrome [Planctomycetota bacterium]
MQQNLKSIDRRPDFEKGRRMFTVGACYSCHRMGVRGGILGPDLTGAGGRYTVKDLLTAIVHPNAVVSDQYAATHFLMDDGRLVTGRVVNMSGNTLRVMTNMLDPSSLEGLNRDEIELTKPSKNSMMPSGLLDTLTVEEVHDLLAYLRSGGNAAHPTYNP